jgi:drug/metabolite transporter (DMT)-like permease
MNDNNHVIGSFLLIAISFNAVVNDIAMKTLAMEGLSPMGINGLRIFFSCIIAIFLGLNNKGFKVFKGMFHWHHWVRNLTTIAALWAVIKSLAVCQIAQVDLINYLIPAFISLISSLFFGEMFNGINFALVMVCIGTFLWRKGLFFAAPLILSALCFSFAEVWIKHKMQQHGFWTMVVSLGVMGSLLLSYSFVPLLWTLNLKQILLSIMMGIGDISILGFITWKSKIGSSHDFLPLRYSSVVFSVIADRFIFHVTNIDYIMITVVLVTSSLTLIFSKNNENLQKNR